jgi:DNA-binding transcriptional ArsR family regulator
MDTTTAQALAALADPVRLGAPILLRHELAAGRSPGIALSTTSKHLAQLREAGFVAERRDGRNVTLSRAGPHRPALVGLLDRVAQEEDAAGDLARSATSPRAGRRPRPPGPRTAVRPRPPWTVWVLI